MLPKTTNGHNSLVDHFMSEPFLNRWSQPAVSIEKEDSEYIASWDMPGLSREDVQITVRDGALRVEGSSEERSYSHALALSDSIETDGIEASLDRGVLRVRLPTRESVGTEIPVE